jgi:AcrR family transcriptional regulator
MMSASRQDRKGTQRERLLAGMLLAAVRKGYTGANVAQVIAHAGVSRPTFYEYFADKDDCFLALHREISEQLLQHIGEAVRSERPERAVQAGIRALVLFTDAQPERARFLINETMAGGPRALGQRDRLIEQIEQVVEQARRLASPESATPDLSTRALLGGICWLLGPRLRRNEHDLAGLADDLTDWIDSYCSPSRLHRWQTLEPGPMPSPSKYTSELALRPPPPLPRGRPNLSTAEIARNQRERILFATADVAADKGYTAATIADITTRAAVDRRVFYSHFRDKQDAFIAVHELAFQQTMAVCASAFFSGDTWPERIWEGLRAGAQFDASYPVLAYIGYVEAYAVGSPAIYRVEDSRAAFSIFVQEGCQDPMKSASRTVIDAISATIFEIGHHRARQRQAQQLPRLISHAAHLVLTPFLGYTAANDFIDEQLRSCLDTPGGKDQGLVGELVGVS